MSVSCSQFCMTSVCEEWACGSSPEVSQLNSKWDHSNFVPQDTWLTGETGQLSQLCAHQLWDQQVADPKHKSLSCNYCKLHLSVLMNTVVQVVQFTLPDVSTNKRQYIPLTLHGLYSSRFCSWLHQLQQSSRRTDKFLCREIKATNVAS